MRTVGIRELKEHTSEILRDVQEGQIIDITSEGSAVARLVPVQPPALSDGEVEAILDDLDSLAAEISARWPANVSAQDAIDDVRR